jgi:hypothetical protein
VEDRKAYRKECIEREVLVQFFSATYLVANILRSDKNLACFTEGVGGNSM